VCWGITVKPLLQWTALLWVRFVRCRLFVSENVNDTLACVYSHPLWCIETARPVSILFNRHSSCGPFSDAQWRQQVHCSPAVPSGDACWHNENADMYHPNPTALPDISSSLRTQSSRIGCQYRPEEVSDILLSQLSLTTNIFILMSG
jgi:hypothetical protein